MQTTWKLEDIYNSPSDEQLRKDQEFVKSSVSDFKQKYQNKLSVDFLVASINEYESIIGMIEKIASYSFLYTQTRLDDSDALAFYQKTVEFLTSVESELVFYELEVAKLDYNKTIEVSGDYRSWIEGLFRFKDHMLSTQVEETLSKKSITSIIGWIRLYDEILSRIDFDFEGKTISLPEIMEIASHSNNSEKREKASRIAGARLEQESFYIKHIYNNILVDKSTNDKLRGYAKPESSRHLNNNIDQISVDNLADAVVDGYKETSQKYYKLKAKLLNKTNFEYWDRNAPVQLSEILNRKFEYREACDIVLNMFGRFSRVFQDIARDFIEKSWIDVYPAKSKTSGAFSHSCCCDVHPYILLNYFGSVRDISTLAHELGHGIHQTLSSKNGSLLSNTPITLSEVASLFSEKLLFEDMYQQTKNDLERIDLICSKLDDTINSVMRQIAFFEFERRAHELRKERELSNQDFCKIFLDTQNECLGSAVNIDPVIGNYWTYISHFFHSPFYVYAYAFGEIFTNALYETYKKSGSEFVETYIDVLSRGGIDRYDVVASRFGLDTGSVKFWKSGVELIKDQVNNLETLCDSAKII
ncbi:MAG: M3 family oligoendopeptidase [Alphaproteobacteria bacterium]|nr:M3 family oligoendopeptidase [Alphaproteobacteria bacterium]